MMDVERERSTKIPFKEQAGHGATSMMILKVLFYLPSMILLS